jgi:hypothetical protein
MCCCDLHKVWRAGHSATAPAVRAAVVIKAVAGRTSNSLGRSAASVYAVSGMVGEISCSVMRKGSQFRALFRSQQWQGPELGCMQCMRGQIGISAHTTRIHRCRTLHESRKKFSARSQHWWTSLLLVMHMGCICSTVQLHVVSCSCMPVLARCGCLPQQQRRLL